MGTSTKIEWTDATWSPVVGCLHVSPACDNCYAERMARRQVEMGNYDPKVMSHESEGHWSGQVQLFPDRLTDPLGWRKPRRIFVVSMGDLFHDGVMLGDIYKVLAVATLAPRHAFQILTKRPERMARTLRTISDNPGKWLSDAAAEIGGDEAGCFVANYINGGSKPKERPDNNPGDGTVRRWPLPNVWLGVTAEDQERFDERWPILAQCSAAVRFISYEPALGPLDMHMGNNLGDNDSAVGWSPCGNGGTWHEHPLGDTCNRAPAPDWVIAGGETGPGARPAQAEWFRWLREQAHAAGARFFYKGAGTATMKKSDPSYNLLDGREWREFPKESDRG